MDKTQKLKTKVRFTSLDVAAMVQNMQILIGMRATNIYDVNPSTYLIKMAKSQDKHYLLIQNGVRFHTTDQKPDKKTIPSGFTMKFRKYLRSKRLQSVRQVGVERVVVFTFGTEAFTNHLILELYSQGNIILTDNNYRILQCIRSHEFNQKVKTAVGEIYPFQYAANIYLENIDVSQNKVDQLLQAQQKANENEKQNAQQGDTKKKKGKKAGKKGPTKLKDVVFKLIPCLFPLVIEHILLSNQKNPDQKVSKQNKQLIVEGAEICLKFLKDYLKSKHAGYLFQKQSKEPAKQGQQKQKQYFQFSSYKNIKYSNQPCRQYPTFNEAVEEYFKNYKKNQHQEQQQFEEIAWKKYDQIKRDQDQRVKKLQEQQDIYKLKAQYIEKNVEDVDAIIKIIKTMEDNGYSWDDIGRMIEESKKNGNPVANMIHQLNILKRQVTVLLGDPIDQNQMYQLLPVEINIDYNAYTNATMYYESKKKNYQKQQRTKQASQQVLKLAEKDALKKIQKKKNQVFAKNLPQRKTFWFEKFNWFISSEGYLIISGRDSHQNELVVKRYMKAGDLYMHSDYGGAASTVIKKHRKDIPIPHSTLEEAAIFTVCRSKAWDTKILSGAWWVYHDQVSKAAPTGEYLPTGSFMIRGKRNFIQPNRMQMGMTLLFKVDNQSAQRHIHDRRIHEQQIKKQQQMKKPQITEQTKQDQEFAIVSIDTQTRKQRQQQIKKQKQNNIPLKKQDSKAQYGKEQNKSQKIVENDSENQDEDQNDSQGEKVQSIKQGVKKPIQTNKNQKAVNNKKQQSLPPQQKHKQRNKKKLKKLEKYLQEQDQDQRQIIMKMLGAKQMKHMKQEKQAEEEQTPKVGDKKNKKTKRDKKDKKGAKKGIGKYFDVESDQEEMKQKLNPDKVLFLKDKKQQQQEDKQLMQNSQESESQQKSQKKSVQRSQKDKSESKEQSKQEEGSQQDGKQEEKSEEKDLNQQDQQQNKEQELKEEDKQKEEDQEIDEKILDSQLGQLFKLVGKPHPQDNVECMVAMCAPYNSIKENKFKIKLVPGGLKKGKAARNILQYFVHSELTEQQKNMLRAVPQQQLINAVISNVKLAGAGLLKMQMKEKQEKKQKRKQEDKKKKEEAA